MKLSFSHHFSGAGCPACSLYWGRPSPSSVTRRRLTVASVRSGSISLPFSLHPAPSFPSYCGYSVLAWGSLEGHFLPASQTACWAPVPSSLVFFPQLPGACRQHPLGIWTQRWQLEGPSTETHVLHSLSVFPPSRLCSSVPEVFPLSLCA